MGRESIAGMKDRFRGRVRFADVRERERERERERTEAETLCNILII